MLYLQSGGILDKVCNNLQNSTKTTGDSLYEKYIILLNNDGIIL